MYFIKSFLVLASIVLLASAVPGVDRRVASGLLVRQDSTGNNCGSTIGDCFQNNCGAGFYAQSDTIGMCLNRTTEYYGCPCNKCGSGGNVTGACCDNGCAGVQGKCTAGQYHGCPCTGPDYVPPGGVQPGGGAQPGGGGAQPYGSQSPYGNQQTYGNSAPQGQYYGYQTGGTQTPQYGNQQTYGSSAPQGQYYGYQTGGAQTPQYGNQQTYGNSAPQGSQYYGSQTGGTQVQG